MKLAASVSLILIVILTGCANKPLKVAYECPRILLPDDPTPATHLLNENSEPDEVIKAWVATAYAYRGWNVAVRKQIENSQ